MNRADDFCRKLQEEQRAILRGLNPWLTDQEADAIIEKIGRTLDAVADHALGSPRPLKGDDAR